MADASHIVIDLGDNALDLALLRGFVGVSGPLRALGLQFEHSGQTLTVRNGKALELGAVSELLRVLGGSCKGDSAIRVVQPEAFADQVAIPQQQSGPERWPCPRCEREVMAGANDSGQLRGLCEPCWTVDMRLGGVADPKSKLRRLGALPALPELVQAPAPSSRPSAPPVPSSAPSVVAALEALRTPNAPQGERGPELEQATPPRAPMHVLWVASPADLPKPELGLCAVSHGRFYWSTGQAWYYLEGHPPPVL